MSPTNHVRMCEHVYHTLEVMSVRCWGKKIKQYLREWPSEIISSRLSDGTDGWDGRTEYSSTVLLGRRKSKDIKAVFIFDII